MLRVFLSAMLLVVAGCAELEQLGSSVEIRELTNDAENMFKEDDFDGALVKWEEAFDLDPTSDEIAFNISRCYAQLGDEEGALDWLRKSIKLTLSPRLDDADLKPLEESEEFQKIRTLADVIADTALLGKTDGMEGDVGEEAWDAYLAGEYEKSAELWEQDFRADQTNERAAFNAACCHSLLGNTEEALKWLRTSFKSALLPFLEDQDLDPVRANAEFKRISETARSIWER